MDYYGIPRLFYTYALAYSIVYAFYSVFVTLVLLTYGIIYKDEFTGFSIKTSKQKYRNSKYRKYKKKLWERKDHGRLERVLQDSDKIKMLYKKWVSEAKSCVSDKQSKNTIEKAIF